MRSYNKNDSYNYIPSSKQNLLNTILKSCDGLGLSGANENTNESLKQYMSYVFSYNKIKNPKKKKPNTDRTFIYLKRIIISQSDSDWPKATPRADQFDWSTHNPYACVFIDSRGSKM